MQHSTNSINKRVQLLHAMTACKTQETPCCQPPSPSLHPLTSLILLTIWSLSPLFIQCTNFSTTQNSSLLKFETPTCYIASQYTYASASGHILLTAFHPSSLLYSLYSHSLASAKYKPGGDCISPCIRLNRSSCHVLAAEVDVKMGSKGKEAFRRPLCRTCDLLPTASLS